MPKLKTAPFSVGDRVTSRFHGEDEEKIVRKVTEVRRIDDYGSGYGVSADGGKRCPTCGVVPGRDIDLVDSAWFKLVRRTRRKK